MKPHPRSMTAVLLGLGLTLSAACASAREARPAPRAAPDPNAVTPAELDAAVEAVITRPEYTWRLPRERVGAEQPPAEREGILWSFLENIGNAIRDGLRTIWKWIEQVLEWMDERFTREPRRPQSPLNWQMPVQILLFAILAVTACTLGIVLYRLWRRRRSGAVPVTATAVPPAAQWLEDDVAADALPSDEWLTLAEELWAQGRTRLALRAMFLGALARLGERDLIAIAPHKSNRDYRRDLQRRAHDQPELIAAFASGVGIIEAVWYGMHTPDGGMIDRFRTHHRRLTERTAGPAASDAPPPAAAEGPNES